MLPAIPSGMTVAFSAIALPQLNLNLIQTSWFGEQFIEKIVFNLNI